MQLKKIIDLDLHRYTAGKSISIFSKRRLYGWNYTKIWRKAHASINSKLLYLIYGFLLFRKSLKYGFQISPYATIGAGLYLGHFGTIIVGNEVVIGNNCNLGPNVVIGRTNRGKHIGSPQIGNRVWIGSGAILVGNITVGNNVLIAPGAYINVDVPDDSIVIGNPATIYPSLNATEGYIDNIIKDK